LSRYYTDSNKIPGGTEMEKEKVGLLDRACYELDNFELRLFVAAVANGGEVVLSKKTICKMTGTQIRNVNLHFKKVDFKGLAELDLIDGTVYRLTVAGGR
jgi:hypothetical protein